MLEEKKQSIESAPFSVAYPMGVAANMLAPEAMLVRGLKILPEKIAPQNPAYQHTFINHFTSASMIACLQYLGAVCGALLVGESWKNLKRFYYQESKTAGNYASAMRDIVRLCAGVVSTFAFTGFILGSSAAFFTFFIQIAPIVWLAAVGVSALHHGGHLLWQVGNLLYKGLSLLFGAVEDGEKVKQELKAHAVQALKHSLLFVLNVILLEVFIKFLLPTDKLTEKFVEALEKFKLFAVINYVNALGANFSRYSSLLAAGVYACVAAAGVGALKFMLKVFPEIKQEAQKMHKIGFENFVKSAVEEKYQAWTEYLVSCKNNPNWLVGGMGLVLGVTLIPVLELLLTIIKLPKFILGVLPAFLGLKVLATKESPSQQVVSPVSEQGFFAKPRSAAGSAPASPTSSTDARETGSDDLATSSDSDQAGSCAV